MLLVVDQKALFTVPLGMLCNAGFLYQWRYWPKRLPEDWSVKTRLSIVTGVSLLVWLVLSGGAFLLNNRIIQSGEGVQIIGVIAFVLIVIVGVVLTYRSVEAPRGTQPVTWAVLLLRGVCGAISITVAVLLGSTSSVMSGIISTFPAIFLTSMVALWLAQGEGVPAGAVAPMMLGSASVPAFAMLFAGLKEPLGILGALILSWLLAVSIVSFPVAVYLRWRERAGQHETMHWHVPLESVEDEAFSMTIDEEELRALDQNSDGPSLFAIGDEERESLARPFPRRDSRSARS